MNNDTIQLKKDYNFDIKRIEIQTTSLCGSSCIICPHSKQYKLSPQGIMQESLFRKIIDNCAELKIEYIIPYLMGDPLTDPKIFERIKYIRKKCGSAATIELSTSFKYLNDKMIECIAGAPISILRVSVLGISKAEINYLMPGVDYDKKFHMIFKLIECIKKKEGIKFQIVLLEGLLPKTRFEEIKLFWRKLDVDVISWLAVSRAGNVSCFPQIRKNSISGCKACRAEHWIDVLFDGVVILCCMDWKREIILGNVCESDLYSIWNSDKRREILSNVMGDIDSSDEFLCKRCEWAREK